MGWTHSSCSHGAWAMLFARRIVYRLVLEMAIMEITNGERGVWTTHHRLFGWLLSGATVLETEPKAVGRK